MKCPNCSNQMVKAKATNFGEEYDYCKTCKKELNEMVPYPPKLEEPPKEEPNLVMDADYPGGYFYLYSTPQAQQPQAGLSYHDWFHHTADCKKCGISAIDLFNIGLDIYSKTCPGIKP